MFYYNVLIYKRQVPIFKKKFGLNIIKGKLFIHYYNSNSELKLFHFYYLSIFLHLPITIFLRPQFYFFFFYELCK